MVESLKIRGTNPVNVLPLRFHSQAVISAIELIRPNLLYFKFIILGLRVQIPLRAFSMIMIMINIIKPSRKLKIFSQKTIRIHYRITTFTHRRIFLMKMMIKNIPIK